MKNLTNKVLLITKFMILIISFIWIMFILLNMYQKLDKSIDIDFIMLIIPFIILIILFFFNFTFKVDSVRNNILYNVTCNISLLSIVYLLYRTTFDKNMIYYFKDGYNINFTYFNEQNMYIKIVMLLMIIINIMLMLINTKKKKLDIME